MRPNYSKTSLEIPTKDWNEFLAKSVEREGTSGMRTAILIKLIKGYNEGRFQVKA